MKALTLSLAFAAAVHSPLLLPALAAAVTAGAAYIIFSLRRTRKVRA